MNGRITVFDGSLLDIEYDLTLPTPISLDELKAMEGDGFHISASGVAIWIKFLSQGNRFQHVLAIFFFHPDSMNSQEEQLGKIRDFFFYSKGHISFVLLSQQGWKWKSFVIPFRSLNYDTDKRPLLLNMSRERLRSPPFFQREDLFISERTTGRHRYYGQHPSLTEKMPIGTTGHPMGGLKEKHRSMEYTRDLIQGVRY